MEQYFLEEDRRSAGANNQWAAVSSGIVLDATKLCSIENGVRESDHSVLASFFSLLSANRRTISQNCRN